MQDRPYIITICSEKGGVGKTTLATNLAIFLKALNEDLPVTILSFDNHYSVDLLFAIGGKKALNPGSKCGGKTVIDLFGDTPVKDLPETGEYGVNYIQSSQQLQTIQSEIDSPLILEKRLHLSGIPGIIIIDTKPTLDIFTYNALAAADRVLIPLKDLPSLENCKNIYGFFRDQQLSRKHLRVIPSLIEARIKYKGAFKNQVELLRAFALNRGYRCLDGYISKSPKVDALNTNPEGKIYPILTHGRGGETYKQYVDITNEIYQDYIAEIHRRDNDQAETVPIQAENESAAILSEAKPCLICNEELSNRSKYYIESCSGMNGYIDKSCFSNYLLPAYRNYREEKISGPDTVGQSRLNTNVFHLIRVQKRQPFSTLYTCDKSGEIKDSIDLPTASMHDKNLTTFLRPFVVEHGSDEPFFLSLEELEGHDTELTHQDHQNRWAHWKDNAINFLKTA